MSFKQYIKENLEDVQIIDFYYEDETTPTWTGPLSEFFDTNIDSFSDEYIQEIKTALEEKGEFVGGGGASPIFKIVLRQ